MRTVFPFFCRCIELLKRYYQGEVTSLDEDGGEEEEEEDEAGITPGWNAYFTVKDNGGCAFLGREICVCDCMACNPAIFT